MLENHDHSACEIHCYSNVVKPDGIALRPVADNHSNQNPYQLMI